MSQPRVYTPPAPKVVQAYARAVCAQLAESKSPVYAQPEVARELSKCLSLLAAILIKVDPAEVFRERKDEVDGPCKKG
jgi:hypothetical protein